MKTETKFVEGQRVRHANAVSNYTTPTNFPKADTPLQGMNGNDLRGLRRQVDDGIRRGIVADQDVRQYHALLDNIDHAIEQRQAKDDNLKSRMQHGSMGGATGGTTGVQRTGSPAILSRGLGDSTASLIESFSISKAISDAAMGRSQSGAEAEVIAEGQRTNPHARGISIPGFVFKRNIYGVDATSGSIAAAVAGQQTLAGQLRTALHDAPVAEQLGATTLQAFGATFLVPYLGNMIAATVAEGAGITSSLSTNELSLTPIRYGRRADLTTLALRAASPDIDRLIMQSMAEGHAVAKDRAAFAAVVANATYTEATPHSTNGLAVTTLADMFNLAKEASTASGSSQAPNVVCSPIGFQALNTAADSTINQTIAGAYRNATGAQVLQANTLQDGNLTSADVVGGTGTIAGAGVAIAGNFADLIIAEWGVDMVIDNLTDADKGVIRCISNSYVAAGVVRDSLRVMGVTASNIAAS
jgi:hypothetical protein